MCMCDVCLFQFRSTVTPNSSLTQSSSILLLQHINYLSHSFTRSSPTLLPFQVNHALFYTTVYIVNTPTETANYTDNTPGTDSWHFTYKHRFAFRYSCNQRITESLSSSPPLSTAILDTLTTSSFGRYCLHCIYPFTALILRTTTETLYVTPSSSNSSDI